MAEFLSLFVEKLLDCIVVPIGRQFGYLFCYNANLEEFRTQLSGLQTLRNDVIKRVEAAERQGEVIFEGVEKWLAKVDAVSDESRLFAGEEDAVSKRCFNGPLNLKVRHQRSRKAKKKAAEINAIHSNGNDFLLHPVSYAAPPLPIRSVNNESEFDFESRMSSFNQIMETTKDDGVKMIGIYGMPGIGKTTLARRVAKYAKDEGSFDEVAMAVVSQNPNVKAIQEQIATMIGFNNFKTQTEEGRAVELHQRLSDSKKKMIILDDIWDRIELNDIGIPSPSQHKGCKIIFTSRIVDVCEQMGTEKNFKIDLLSKNEALDLFLRMSRVDDRSSEKGQLAGKLSEECGRLPISIVVVARGLLNKPEVTWKDRLNRLRNSDPDKKVCACIQLSYDNLYREEEKMFFLLCALFPEDYQIRVEFLFEYGIGLNLFEKVDNLDQAGVRAQDLALKLKSQCLLLDGDDERYVKMHDVIRDVARAIASTGKDMFLVPEKKEKMAMSLCYDDIHKLPYALECPQLQILTLNGQGQDFPLHDSFFAGMKNLIVLHMFDVNCVRLPQSFASLENLRTLLLSTWSLEDISGIGRFRNLVSLRIHSGIEVLPKEVGELTNLRLLDLWDCEKLKVIYSGVIQNLSRLEVLRMGRNVQWGDRKQEGCSKNASLSELTHLSRLMILEIDIPEASMLPDDVLLFENLTKFEVTIGDPFKFGEMTINFNTLSRQILKFTRLSQNELLKGGIKNLMKKAEYLKMQDILGIFVALPSLIGGYGSLKGLLIYDCKDVNYVLDASEIGHETLSPQILYLIDLPSLKEISKGELPSLFSSKLEHLELDTLPSLVRLWPFQVESNLTIMEVASCHKLEYVFDMSSVDCLLKLQTLEVRGCINLQVICVSKEQDEGIVFPRLRDLVLSELQNLTSFSSDFTSQSTLFGEQVNFGALETLNIDNVEKLEKIWHIKTRVESFFRLKALKLIRCPELLVVFPPQATSGLRDLEELCIENCDKLETLFESDDVRLAVGDEMVLFPQLLTLKLISLPKLMTFLATTSQNISQAMDRQLSTFFPKLEKLDLEDIGHLFLTVYPLDLDKGLEALKELRIKDNNASTLPQVLATIPKLKILELQNLTSLNFSICNGLKSLLISSGVRFLVHLESLIVSGCENMESIVGDAKTEPNFEKSIEFSRLHALELDNLHSLAKFYSGECVLKFPCLEVLSIINCPKLKIFASMARETPEPGPSNFMPQALFGQQVSFGRLRSLTLKRLESVEDIWHSGHLVMAMGELQYLDIEGCDRLLKLFSSNLLAGLQNLEYLDVQSCRSLEHVFAVEDHPPLLTKLSRLRLSDLPKLKQLWWNENGRESFGIPSLDDLMINNCPALQFIFNPSVADSLETLECLEIENCSSMVEIVAENPDKKVKFPCIRKLRLVNLPCFKVNQNVEFPRLWTVIVDRCFNVRERCEADLEKLLAKPVKSFESIVEWSKSGSFLEPSPLSLDSDEEAELVGDEPSQHGERDEEDERVAENRGFDC